MRTARFLLILASIGLGAFLLFMVQPMAGKFLLPLLGGGPSVWNTAMVFFQIVLLAGYALAHAASLQPVRVQLLIPVGLMALGAIISLPMAPPIGLLGKPDVNHPALWQFIALALMAGLPFLALSTLSPLLQRWFANVFPDRNPYALYRTSNIGSFLGLLAYPFVAEPLLTLKGQGLAWCLGYAILLVTLTCLAALLWRMPDRAAKTATVDTPSPERKDYGLWLFLSAVPSALLLGVTAYITTDVASLPLFWIMPLALYLLSFVFGFSDKLAPLRPLLQVIQLALMLLVLWIITTQVYIGQGKLMTVHLALFFINALVCHQLLFLSRPDPAHLTKFYLTTSMGGALGGVCIALLAPVIFPLPIEYPVTIALCLLTLLMKVRQGEHDEPRIPYERLVTTLIVAVSLLVFDMSTPLRVALGTVLIIALSTFYPWRRLMAICLLIAFIMFPIYPWNNFVRLEHLERTYFGVLRVYQDGAIRKLTNGTTMHGMQMLDPKGWKIPLSYYSAYSPLADVMSVLDDRKDPTQHIAALGLGIGSVACYPAPGREFTFFDIDPAVVGIAIDQRFFHYLSHCGSPYQVKLGDARLTLAGEPDGIYDLILVDVFSSDSIPVHMMTEDAVDMYMRKLKPDGFLLFHTSNRHFLLEPEVARIAHAKGLSVMVRDGYEGVIIDDIRAAGTNYVVVTKDQATLMPLLTKEPNWERMPEFPGKPWSDDYVNIVRAIRSFN